MGVETPKTGINGRVYKSAGETLADGRGGDGRIWSSSRRPRKHTVKGGQAVRKEDSRESNTASLSRKKMSQQADSVLFRKIIIQITNFQCN